MELAHRLISTRRGSLYLAIVAALLALVIILVYVNRYRASVASNNTPVTVLVARKAIQKGTPGNVVASTGLFTAATIKESQLREGALSDPASLRGRVATADIYEGQQLTASEFSASANSLSSTITAHQRIVAVPLDSAHGLIGNIHSGDHVDVYAGFNVIPVRPDGSPAGGGQAQPMLRLIVANAPVAAISSSGSGLGTRTTNVSLRVNDTQAAKLAFASDNGKVWLALRPAAGAKTSPSTIVNADTLLLGISPVTVVRAYGGRR